MRLEATPTGNPGLLIVDVEQHERRMADRQHGGERAAMGIFDQCRPRAGRPHESARRRRRPGGPSHRQVGPGPAGGTGTRSGRHGDAQRTGSTSGTIRRSAVRRSAQTPRERSATRPRQVPSRPRRTRGHRRAQPGLPLPGQRPGDRRTPEAPHEMGASGIGQTSGGALSTRISELFVRGRFDDRRAGRRTRASLGVHRHGACDHVRCRAFPSSERRTLDGRWPGQATGTRCRLKLDRLERMTAELSCANCTLVRCASVRRTGSHQIWR